MGRCIDLDDLFLPGEVLAVTDEEYRQAVAEFSPDVAKLLRIIDAITRGQRYRKGVAL